MHHFKYNCPSSAAAALMGSQRGAGDHPSSSPGKCTKTNNPSCSRSHLGSVWRNLPLDARVWREPGSLEPGTHWNHTPSVAVAVAGKAGLEEVTAAFFSKLS